MKRRGAQNASRVWGMRAPGRTVRFAPPAAGALRGWGGGRPAGRRVRVGLSARGRAPGSAAACWSFIPLGAFPS